MLRKAVNMQIDEQLIHVLEDPCAMYPSAFCYTTFFKNMPPAARKKMILNTDELIVSKKVISTLV